MIIVPIYSLRLPEPVLSHTTANDQRLFDGYMANMNRVEVMQDEVISGYEVVRALRRRGEEWIRVSIGR